MNLVIQMILLKKSTKNSSESGSGSNSSSEESSKSSNERDSTGRDDDSDVEDATEGDGEDSEEYNSQESDMEDEIVDTLSKTSRRGSIRRPTNTSMAKRQSLMSRALRSPRNLSPTVTSPRYNNRASTTRGRGRGRRGRPPGRKTTKMPMLQKASPQQEIKNENAMITQETSSENNDKDFKDLLSDEEKEQKIEDNLKLPLEENKEQDTLKDQINSNSSLVIECFADGEDLGDLIDFCAAHTYSDLLIKMIEKFPHLNSVDKTKLMLYYVNYQNKKIKITESNYECTYYLRRNQLKEIHIVSRMV